MVNGTLTNRGHAYTDYHPRWLRRHVSTYWWLEKPAYFAFILREATCLFVAWFAVYLLLLIAALVNGPVAYEQFLAWSATPWVILLNVVSFAMLVFHAITFFDAAPQALVVHLGRRRVPGQLVLIGHYAAWAGASAAVMWLLVRA
jgi:fumarate reductase subunit C